MLKLRINEELQTQTELLVSCPNLCKRWQTHGGDVDPSINSGQASTVMGTASSPITAAEVILANMIKIYADILYTT